MRAYKVISGLVISRRRLSMGLGVILALSAFVFSEPAAALSNPQAVVALVGAEGMATLPRTSRRHAKLHELFDRYFDVDGSAEFALGRYRNIATAQQLQEFFRLYGEYTVRTYGERLNQVGVAPFRVTGGRLTGRSAIVGGEVQPPRLGACTCAHCARSNAAFPSRPLAPPAMKNRPHEEAGVSAEGCDGEAHIAGSALRNG